jgi:hypothetical protein
MISMSIRSTQHRALQVLEIVELIFSFADQQTTRQCAMVCRFWRELALNSYWSCLDEYDYFAMLLLPYLLPEISRCKCRLGSNPRIVRLLKDCSTGFVPNDSAHIHSTLITLQLGQIGNDFSNNRTKYDI